MYNLLIANLSAMKQISKTVWMLAWISLFTDAASEMLYPVMPIFLKTIGFSTVLIGILEGVAEAVAGLSKGYFGKYSDLTGRRVPFIQAGYTLSAISKPMMALFAAPIWIFFVRTLDRIGKGVRTGARDALLSSEATPQTKGQIFGFHRSMDTMGAVIGPSIALIYLYFFPANYKTLFILALIPGLLAIGLTLMLREKRTSAVQPIVKPHFFSFLRYWGKSPVTYRRVVIGLLLFTLFNSSDIFLLLKVKQSGLSDGMVIGVYILYNLTYALLAYPIGILADKIGLKSTLFLGLTIYAAVYWGIAVNNNLYHYFILFILYGLYASATEGISKAWITNITDREDCATAIGTFTGLQSICTLISSTLTGIIWFRFGSGAALMTAAVATIGVIAYLMIATRGISSVRKNL